MDIMKSSLIQHFRIHQLTETFGGIDGANLDTGEEVSMGEGSSLSGITADTDTLLTGDK